MRIRFAAILLFLLWPSLAWTTTPIKRSVDSINGLTVPTIGASISSDTNTQTLQNKTWNGVSIGSQYGGTGQNFSASSGAISVSSGTFSAGTLSVGNGGTGATTLTTNGMVYGNSTSAVGITAAGSQYQVFQSGSSGVPTVDAVHLDQSAAVTGVLPVANQTIATQAISASAIDWSTGSLFTKTLGANTTFTFSNKTSGQTIVVRLTNTSSNWTVTWPTVKWVGGTAPTMTTGAHSDVYTFIWDGTDIYGSAVQNF